MQFRTTKTDTEAGQGTEECWVGLEVLGLSPSLLPTLDRHQSAYHSNRSTERAIISSCSDPNCLDNSNSYVRTLFIAFSSAQSQASGGGVYQQHPGPQQPEVQVPRCPHLPVHSWALNKTNSHKNSHKQLYFLRLLKDVHLFPLILVNFYRSSTGSVLRNCVPVWYRSCAEAGQKTLWQVD